MGNAQGPAVPVITYSLAVAHPREHRAQCSVRVPSVAGRSLDLVLPSWAPGSYKIQVAARGVRDVRAWAGDGRERPLGIERIDKARWRVAVPEGEDRVEVAYEVYGHGIGTKAVDLTSDHWFLNPVFCLPYIDGRTTEPLEVVLRLPDGWKAFSELERVGADPLTLRARDYDELVDSPIDCGTPLVVAAPAAGVPHEVVLCGAGGNFDPARLTADLGRVAEAAIRLFGRSPLTHYTWFVHLADAPGGGLEHRASCSLVVPRTTFEPASRYRRFLRLCAHEYFHLYQVKRIRPKVLGPFDYTRENYTRLLWAMEGTTDYYAHLLLRRAGLVSPKRFFSDLAVLVRQLSLVPGRAVTDLETASFQTWIDLYHPYEESGNQSVSYYLKGALVSLCLDLDLRRRTENRASLDTVLRHLWREYGEVGRGIGEDELQGAMEAATGVPLQEFFDRYVRGTDELDIGAFVRAAGLELQVKEQPREDDDDAPPGYLGLDHEDAGGTVRVTRVLAGGPARLGGVAPGDEIVAVNGAKVTPSSLASRLAELPVGRPASLSVFRRGWLTTVPVVPAAPPPEAYVFRPVPNASAVEQAIYAGWVDAPWEPAPPPAPDSVRSAPGTGTALRP